MTLTNSEYSFVSFIGQNKCIQLTSCVDKCHKWYQMLQKRKILRFSSGAPVFGAT